MKKLIVAAIAALCVAFNPAIAQENAGGINSSDSASGKLSNPTVVTAAVGVAITAAMIANNRGGTTIAPPVITPCGADEILVDGVCQPIEPPVCNDDEILVDGVCQPIEPPVCNDDEELVDGVCIPKPPVCNDDEELVDGVCVPKPPVCNDGEVLVDGECVNPGTTVTITSTNTITTSNTVAATVTNTTTNTATVTSTN